MKNYRMYLPGFCDLRESIEYDGHYSLNTRLYFKSEYLDPIWIDHIIPVKRESMLKKLFQRKKKPHNNGSIDRVIVIESGSDANLFLTGEYGNNLARDSLGRYIVPYSYIPDIQDYKKTR